MQLTTNYQFKMPDQTDNYNIQNQNDNWSSLDTIIKSLNTSVTNAQNAANAAIPASEIGSANGVAGLDANSLILSANLPKATSNALGAVKIGTGISLAGDGTISVTLPSDFAKTDVSQTWTADQTFSGTVTATTFSGALSGNASSASSAPWSGITGKPIFAAVATSGSFADLTNKPTTLAGYGVGDSDPLLLNEFNVTSSNPDANGNYTVVTYKRTDNTTYMVSTLSGTMDANGNYPTMTNQYYDAAGTTIVRTETWTLTWDTNGKLSARTVVIS